MKFLPFLIWVIQAAVWIGGAVIANILIHNPGIETAIWIIAGIIVVASFLFAFFMAHTMGREGW